MLLLLLTCYHLYTFCLHNNTVIKIIEQSKMGKEPAGVHRPPKFIRRVQSQSDLASEASSAWSAIKTSHTEIAENGYVVVILRYKTDTMVVCTGLKNEGNKFIKLGRLLKRGGVVPRQGVDLTFFVQRNIVWEYVEDWKKGSYRSGEKLLVLVEKKNTRQFKRAQVNKNMILGVKRNAIKKHNVDCVTQF
eukprot:TRINITY_DN1879_c0_g1_i3.p2 TRINITY_DN1879_c0_g1~~TRINITY_DN1879_c0_g1_i3.p2  ORF type:complete len:197 (-),score=10.96 TRINITY_DN1879_c0_g1_i3:141-710(-)